MPFDFPAAPAIGDLYEPLGGPPYTWDGVAWMAQATGGASGDFVLKTGDMMTGALVLPITTPVQPAEAAHKTYVDENTLYQGVWQPGPNIPDLTPATANALPGYSWIASTADPATQETPPAGIPGLSTLMISNADAIIWDAVGAAYKVIRPPLTPAAGTNGDVKAGFQPADHNGWIKLDGRAVTTLTPSQQTVAASLGFTANLPNASNLVMMQTGGAMGIGVGSMNKKITQANLPAYNMTTGGTGGTTDSQGTHKHSLGRGHSTSGPRIQVEDWINNDTRWDNTSTIANHGNEYLGSFDGAMADAGAHTHNITSHTHAVGSGGSGADFNITPASLSVNQFVFLGL